MLADEITTRYIGGSTALFQIGGLRFVLNPCFDPAGTVYHVHGKVVTKTTKPLIAPQQLDKMDFVLLTGKTNVWTLDSTGREYLNYVEYVFTSAACLPELGTNSVALRLGSCWI